MQKENGVKDVNEGENGIGNEEKGKEKIDMKEKDSKTETVVTVDQKKAKMRKYIKKITLMTQS